MISAQRHSPKSSKEVPSLVNGDHLNQATFHERYEAMPGVYAELIGGIVFMSSPQKIRHSQFHRKVAWLVNEYVDETPGTDGGVNTTNILGPDSEPQPDACLFIFPECGGQTTVTEGYLSGAPEWIGEISDSTESLDLNRKKLDYEKAGVREYMVVAVRSQEVFWFSRRRGKFKLVSAPRDGIIRSEILPGFWIDPVALLNGDGRRLQAVARQGLASDEHAVFVDKLASRKTRQA